MATGVRNMRGNRRQGVHGKTIIPTNAYFPPSSDAGTPPEKPLFDIEKPVKINKVIIHEISLTYEGAIKTPAINVHEIPFSDLVGNPISVAAIKKGHIFTTIQGEELWVKWVDDGTWYNKGIQIYNLSSNQSSWYMPNWGNIQAVGIDWETEDGTEKGINWSNMILGSVIATEIKKGAEFQPTIINPLDVRYEWNKHWYRSCSIVNRYETCKWVFKDLGDFHAPYAIRAVAMCGDPVRRPLRKLGGQLPVRVYPALGEVGYGLVFGFKATLMKFVKAEVPPPPPVVPLPTPTPIPTPSPSPTPTPTPTPITVPYIKPAPGDETFSNTGASNAGTGIIHFDWRDDGLGDEVIVLLKLGPNNIVTSVNYNVAGFSPDSTGNPWPGFYLMKRDVKGKGEAKTGLNESSRVSLKMGSETNVASVGDDTVELFLCKVDNVDKKELKQVLACCTLNVNRTASDASGVFSYTTSYPETCTIPGVPEGGQGTEEIPTPTPTPNPTPTPTPTPTPGNSVGLDFMCDNSVEPESIITEHWVGDKAYSQTSKDHFHHWAAQQGLSGRQLTGDFYEDRNFYLDFLQAASGLPTSRNKVAVPVDKFHKLLWKAYKDAKAGTVSISETYQQFKASCATKLPCLTELQIGSLFFTVKSRIPSFFIDRGIKFLVGTIPDTMCSFLSQLPSVTVEWIDYNDINPTNGPNSIVGGFAWDSFAPTAPEILKEFTAFINFEPEILMYGTGSAYAANPRDYLKPSPGESWGSRIDGTYPNSTLPKFSNGTEEDRIAIVAGEIALHEYGHTLDFYGANVIGKHFTQQASWRNIGGWGMEDEPAPLIKSQPASATGNMPKTSTGKEAPPTDYACWTPYEDFAESFRYFIMNPTFLQTYHPQRFAFIKAIYDSLI